MTNEEKQLLIKDLCDRLPYGTICEDVYGNSGILLDLTPELNALTLKISDLGSTWTTDIDNVKAYLRPMSSMTGEEEIEMTQILEEVYDSSFTMNKLVEDVRMQEYIPSKYVDWLNKHHFDYRGLIPKGLALEAPEDMYNH